MLVAVYACMELGDFFPRGVIRGHRPRPGTAFLACLLFIGLNLTGRQIGRSCAW